MLSTPLSTAILILSLTLSNGSNENQTVCTDDGCQTVSKFLYSKVDRIVKPCDDFYGFVCGKVLKDENAKSTRDNWKIEVDKSIQKILQDSSLYASKFPIRSAKRFFERCLDLDVDEKDLHIQVKQFVEEFPIDGGSWPALTVGKSVKFDVWQTAAKLQGELSIRTFFDLKISPSTKCESKIWTPNVFVKKSFYTEYANEQFHNEPNVSETLQMSPYQEFLNDSVCADKISIILKTFFPDKLSSDAIDKVCQFEHILLDYFDPKANRMEPPQELFLAEIDTVKVKNRVWKKYFNQIAQDSTKLQEWFESDRFGVEDLSFLEHLVKTVESAPKDVVGNYLFLKIVDFVNGFFAKQKLETDRSDSCMKATIDLFPRIVGHLYVNPDRKGKNDSDVLMVEGMLRSAAKEIFRDNQWLTAMAKVRINRKIDHIKTSLEQDKSITDLPLLELMYEDKKVKNKDTFFDIVRRFSKFSDSSLDKKLGSYGTDMDEFDIVSAYIKEKNFAFLPFGLLKNIGFYDKFPDFYTFGVGGSIIGQNMFRGLIGEGAKRNHKGILVQSDNSYLLHKSAGKFEGLNNCFVNDFANRYESDLTKPDWRRPFKKRSNRFGSNDIPFITFDMYDEELMISAMEREEIEFREQNRVYSKDMLDENLVYFMGLKVAFKAFKNLTATRSPVTIENFNMYSEDQMFFISYASTWCSPQRNDQIGLIKLMKARSQSFPDDARVTQQMRNSIEFRKAFGCQKGDQMYQNSLRGQCELY